MIHGVVTSPEATMTTGVEVTTVPALGLGIGTVGSVNLVTSPQEILAINVMLQKMVA